jgi:hypothetical protein
MLPAVSPNPQVDAAKKLGGHLWLNADVFAGPGYPERFLSPIDARHRVKHGAVGRSDWSAGGFSKEREPQNHSKEVIMVIQYRNPCFWGTPILRNTQLARGNCVDYFAICFETDGLFFWWSPLESTSADVMNRWETESLMTTAWHKIHNTQK